MDMDTLDLVFVYGTLKTGEPNHPLMQENSEGVCFFRCDAATVEKYPLIIASKYNIPFLLDAPGIGHCVRGEIYAIDEARLRVLDRLEQHPRFFTRERRRVQPLDDTFGLQDLSRMSVGSAILSEVLNTCDDSTRDDDGVLCWIYLMQGFKSSLLQEPYMQEYHSDGEHRRPYLTGTIKYPGYHAAEDIKEKSYISN